MRAVPVKDGRQLADLSVRPVYCTFHRDAAIEVSNSDGTMTKRKPKRFRVLLAEDDAAMRKFMVDSLHKDNYDVVEITNGNELRHFMASLSSRSEERAESPQIDVIISDVRMPGRTALDVLAEFRHVAKDVPVILITAFCDPQTHDDAFALGAVAVFDTPFDIGELKETLSRLHSPAT